MFKYGLNINSLIKENNIIRNDDMAALRVVVLFQELHLQLFWQLCFASRAGALEPGQI